MAPKTCFGNFGSKREKWWTHKQVKTGLYLFSHHYTVDLDLCHVPRQNNDLEDPRIAAVNTTASNS